MKIVVNLVSLLDWQVKLLTCAHSCLKRRRFICAVLMSSLSSSPAVTSHNSLSILLTSSRVNVSSISFFLLETVVITYDGALLNYQYAMVSFYLFFEWRIACNCPQNWPISIKSKRFSSIYSFINSTNVFCFHIASGVSLVCRIPPLKLLLPLLLTKRGSYCRDSRIAS